MKTIKILVFISFLFCINFSLAEGFTTPPILRPRVNFWIDVFTRYGKYQHVVHHRMFPQVVFGVVDVSNYVETKSPRELESIERVLKSQYIKEVYDALKVLAVGNAPRTSMEKKVAKAMELHPGGANKYNQTIKEQLVRTQQGIREKSIEALIRSGRYLPTIERIFTKEFGLPIQLTRIPFIESSFDYQAYSSVGAAGIWQFMRATARSHGLRINNFYDERRDVVLATRGAAKYLLAAYRSLGNWPLAITSYNHGVGGVRKKANQMGTRDLAKIIENPRVQLFGFASNNFYPEYLAALEIYTDYQKYFPGLKIEPARNFVSYPLPHSFTLGHIENKLGISRELLQDFNYALSSQVWAGRYQVPRGYILNIPAQYQDKAVFLQASQAPGITASSVYAASEKEYRIRRGDTLISIAKKFGVSVNELKVANNLKHDRLYQGQIIKIEADQQERHFVRAEEIPARATQQIYVVKPGDSLWQISKKFGISTNKLKALNGLRTNNIKAGQRLKLG